MRVVRRRRSPSVGEVLVHALPRKAHERVFSVELLRSRWSDAVGEELARRSEPEALDEGVLTVRVADERWGRMLVKLQRQIIGALNGAVGLSVVRRVNFVKRHGWKPAAGRCPEPPEPPSPNEPPVPESVDRAAHGIVDEELRTIVARSAARYLNAKVKKGQS